MWIVKDIYPCRNYPGNIAVAYRNEDEPKNMKLVMKSYRSICEAREEIPAYLEWLEGETRARNSVIEKCELLKLEFGVFDPADEQEANAAVAE